VTPLQRARLFTGFLVSPLILPLLAYIALLVQLGLQNYNSPTTLTAIKTIIWMNYVVVLTLGIPAYLVSRARGMKAFHHYAMAGLALGMILVVLLSHNFVYVFYIVFGIAGTLEGMLFWFIAVYQPVTQRRRGRRSRRRRRRK